MQRFFCIAMTASLPFYLGAAICLGEAGTLETTLFHPQADHPWNRLHAAFWLREAADGTIHGRDRLDPLLWRETQHLTSGDSAKQALERLDEFLALQDPGLKNETTKRAILQRDLWAVFDWLANREHATELSNDPADVNRRRQLRRKLAEAIQRLALDRRQIETLPDNYRAAVESKRFSTDFDPQHAERAYLPADLMDENGPWVGLGTSDGPVAPAHVRGDAGFARSAFTAFLRLPGGRQETLAYLERLRDFDTPWVKQPGQRQLMMPNLQTPQFPAGTRVALLRRMLLVDSQGRLTPTSIVEQLQIRVYRRIEEMRLRTPQDDPPQLFFEFVLSRPQLLSTDSSGLRAVAADEVDFTPVPFAHGFDELEYNSEVIRTGESKVSSRMHAIMESCAGCHRKPGVLSFNVYTRDFGPRHLRPTTFFETGTERADQMSVIAKQQRYDWGLLSGLWLWKGQAALWQEGKDNRHR